MKVTIPKLDNTTLVILFFIVFVAGAFVAKMVGDRTKANSG